MSRAGITFATAKARVAEKYGESITLLSYNGSNKPCTILCEKHGEVEVSTYTNLLYATKFGCPKCAEVSRKTKSAAAATKSAHVYKAQGDLIKTLLSFAQQPLSDAEFGKKARELAKEFLNG